MNKQALEEIKKEWEELGYKWSSDVDEEIFLKMPIKYTTKYVIITISSVRKAYWKRVNDNLENLNYLPFLFKEHQLLTKTFKALGWYEDDN